VIDGFIADFFCEEAKLVIEVDGGVHDSTKQKELDLYREKVFKARGILTVRFRNEDVLLRSDEVVQRIQTSPVAKTG